MINFDIITTELYKLNKSEKSYLKNNRLSNTYFKKDYKLINNKKIYIFEHYITNGEDFAIQKHNRFAPVPTHIHDFIEVNYIFNGTCKQVIDGKNILLKKGEICLIDTAIPHSIGETNEQDIIINILISKDYFREFLSNTSLNEGVITDFILNTISKTANHKQYIIFKNKEFSKIHHIVCMMLKEYYNNDIGSIQASKNYLNIFFLLLLRDFNYETNNQLKKQDQKIIKILNFIELNYETIKLHNVAEKFNYSPNYLSSLLKIKVGKSFSELICEKRLNKAKNLLKNTDLSITEIASISGFSNLTSFYRKYKEKYNRLPSQRD